MVQAANSNGEWVGEVKSFRVKVLTPFWNQLWFILLLAVITAAIIYFFFRSYVNHQLQKQKAYLEKQHVIQMERERILADLHDDMGGGLSSIRIIADLMLDQPAKLDNSAAYIQKISGITKEITQKMNTIIWALNAENDTLENFAEYVRQYAVSFFENTAIRFTFNTTNLNGNHKHVLNGNIRRALFLATKEALNNIIRHSKATAASVEIIITDELTIKVTDNGIGITNNNRFGNGLKSMHRRMAEVGGSLTKNSTNGTKIEFKVPLSINAFV